LDQQVFQSVSGQSQSIIFLDQYHVQIQLAEVSILFTNSDHFFNQEVALTSYGQSTLQTHGLLGQTWRDEEYTLHGIKRVYEGTSADYMIQDENIFGDDFVYNRFEHTN